MPFVPEGQADSSQARSAWSHEKNSPVPAGRLNGSRLRLACIIRRKPERQCVGQRENTLASGRQNTDFRCDLVRFPDNGVSWRRV